MADASLEAGLFVPPEVGALQLDRSRMFLTPLSGGPPLLFMRGVECMLSLTNLYELLCVLNGGPKDMLAVADFVASFNRAKYPVFDFQEIDVLTNAKARRKKAKQDPTIVYREFQQKNGKHKACDAYHGTNVLFVNPRIQGLDWFTNTHPTYTHFRLRDLLVEIARIASARHPSQWSVGPPHSSSGAPTGGSDSRSAFPGASSTGPLRIDTSSSSSYLSNSAPVSAMMPTSGGVTWGQSSQYGGPYGGGPTSTSSMMMYSSSVVDAPPIRNADAVYSEAEFREVLGRYATEETKKLALRVRCKEIVPGSHLVGDPSDGGGGGGDTEKELPPPPCSMVLTFPPGRWTQLWGTQTVATHCYLCNVNLQSMAVKFFKPPATLGARNEQLMVCRACQVHAHRLSTETSADGTVKRLLKKAELQKLLDDYKTECKESRPRRDSYFSRRQTAMPQYNDGTKAPPQHLNDLSWQPNHSLPDYDLWNKFERGEISLTAPNDPLLWMEDF